MVSFTLPVLSPFFDNRATQEPAPNEASRLPDFVLPAVDSEDIRLSERAAAYSSLVLIFHRGLECKPCRAQLIELQSRYNDLHVEGAEVLAIGLDDQLGTQRLTQQLGIGFPMLYDKPGAVASTYGVYELLVADYTTVILIVDDELKLITNPVGTIANQLLPAEVILDLLRETNGSGGTAS